MPPPVILHQFEFSHFNEKARWALDYKRVDHERRSYLPGPHIPTIRRLSGQTATPVLDWQGQVIAGSTSIITHLETMIPEPALLPSAAEARQDTLDLMRQWDEVTGPAVRTVLFATLVNHGRYMTRMFGRSKGRLKRALYAATFPMLKGIIKKANGVNPENLVLAREQVDAALDEVARRTAPTGYLIGNTFTAADLTAAALLAPLANPSHPAMRRPAPVPAPLKTLIERYADHPGIAWVNQMYQRHRP